MAGLPVVQIKIDRSAIARYGINVSDIQDVITTAIGGKAASQVLEGQMRFDLLVRFTEEARNNVEEIKNILISAPGGVRVPLTQLADISVEEGLTRSAVRTDTAVSWWNVMCGTGILAALLQRRKRRYGKGWKSPRDIIWTGVASSRICSGQGTPCNRYPHFHGINFHTPLYEFPFL